MITQRTVQAVFEQARIEEVVGDFLNLRRRGSNLIGLCPFHDEKTPSFSVSPAKNIYKCFGCGRGGDAVKFVMEHERYTFPEAVRFIAAKYQIPVEETQRTDEDQLLMQESESLRLLNEFACVFFVQSLHDSQEGRAVGMSYFKERGFLESTIRKFELGYAPDQNEALRIAALEAGYSEERLKALGLLNQNGRDMYRGRVIFPIHNLSGKVIAFGARTLKSGPREPKYINSPESAVYSKRKVLYGLHLAKNAIRKADLCYLVEGYTDTLSLVQAGIENVVSSSGTALTQEQARMIRRFTHNITILYDGDPAGVKAALRGLDLLLEEDMFVRLVMLPPEHDPDSLVKSLGHTAFTEFLERETKDFILFKTGLLSAESQNDPVKRSVMVRDIVQSISLIPDSIRRSAYLKECSQLLAMDERMLVQETAKAIQANLKRRQLSRPRAELDADFDALDTLVENRVRHPQHDRDITVADEYQERNIVRLLIQSGCELVEADSQITVAQYILDNIRDVLDTFDHPLYAAIVKRFDEAWKAGHILRQEDLRSDPDPQIAHLVLDILATPFEYSENWINSRNLPLLSQRPPEENFGLDSRQSVLRFKEFKIQKYIEENKVLIQKYQQENNTELLNMHLKIHKELQRMKKELSDGTNSIGIRL
ncbi:MAG TPA: DNA primase [Saprospiraceae bacterium]|nr:DNA primase [Saprospiraceae bacterium]